MIPRYNRPEIEKIWSNQNKFKIWTEIECLIAEQLANLGKIPKQASIDIRSNAKFNVQEIEEIEKKTKHDVIAYINNVNSYIGKSSKYFHHGVTSSDIIDTGFSIQLKQTGEIIAKQLKKLINTLRDQKCATKSITTKENNIILVKPEKEELGFVGMPSEINQNILNEIIEAKEVPIIAPMGLDKNGQTYNVNADTAAGAIAKELKSRRLLLMTDIEGVIDSNNNLVTEITPEVAKKMIEDEVIKGGMIPKINTCIDVVNNGVRGVVIIDGRKPHSILFELFSDKGAGTLIRK